MTSIERNGVDFPIKWSNNNSQQLEEKLEVKLAKKK